MTSVHLFLLSQLLAFWPVWRWYVARVTDASDAPLGLVALGTALLFLLTHGKPKPLTWRPLLLSSVLVLAYVLTWPWCPALLRAALALMAIGCTLSSFCLGRALHPGMLGLFLLSLPLMASLQFYIGYPARLATAHVAAHLLQLTGVHVVAQGPALAWLGEVIAVDAPCAGMRMLWTGLYWHCTLACFLSLPPWATWLTYGVSVGVIFLGNVLRASLLFYGEAGLVTWSTSMHAGVGLAVFASVAVAIFLLTAVVKRRTLCAEEHVSVCSL
jgi:exosortase/archaeosortase family protein